MSAEAHAPSPVPLPAPSPRTNPLSVIHPEATHAPDPAPLGGRILTPAFLFLFALGAVGASVMLYRFIFGLESVTNLSNAWPWGIWKPLNVVSVTGIGAGGYGLALVVYVMNGGRYHPLVRPALLTSALAYTVAGASVLVDLGRWWSILKVPAYVWLWNGNSVLLEVAICVLTYVLVLWTEVSPGIADGLAKSAKSPRTRRWAAGFGGKVSKAMPFVIAFGVVLPSLHQSSLGGMYMISTYLHPLWHTAFLPALFLSSCLVMGYAAVVAQDTITRRVLGRPQDNDLLPRLSKLAVWMVGIWWGLRLVDLAVQGRLGLVFAGDRFSLYFLAELGAAFAGAGILMVRSLRENPGARFGAALLLIFSGVLYRFSTYLLAIQPRLPGDYFPSVGELLSSVGLISLALCVFIFVVKKFPIIAGPVEPQPRRREATP